MPLLLDGLLKSDQKESQKSKANRLETPPNNYYDIVNIIKRLGIDPPELDVFASNSNSKCINFIDEKQDAYSTEFLIIEKQRGIEVTRVPLTIFSNAPHNDYKRALIRIHQQYLKHDFNAISLIPTVNMRTNYWHKIVEPNRIEVNPKGYCFYFPLKGTIYFELDHNALRDKNGRISHSQDAYNILLFVKKSKLKDFKSRLPQVFGNGKR